MDGSSPCLKAGVSAVMDFDETTTFLLLYQTEKTNKKYSF